MTLGRYKKAQARLPTALLLDQAAASALAAPLECSDFSGYGGFGPVMGLVEQTIPGQVDPKDN